MLDPLRARPCRYRYTDRVSREPVSRETELAIRLLKYREHRARLLAASRRYVASSDGEETRRHRLIARADHEIARIEAALRAKRTAFKASPAPPG